MMKRMYQINKFKRLWSIVIETVVPLYPIYFEVESYNPPSIEFDL